MADAHRALKQDEEANKSLLQAVLARDNLKRAYKRVRSNKGAPGIDGVRTQDFREHARRHWRQVQQQIEQGRYVPQPVKRVEIPKADGGKRLLGIPTVMDRVIQQAIAQVLTPILDARFSASSFGFRPGRNAHQAIRQVQGYVREGWRMAVDLDLAKFFDTVNHDLLMRLLAQDIADKGLLKLIASYLRAGVLVGEHIEPSEVGTPQGGPLSPLLANVLLHQLDCELERRGHRFARYADDLVILVKTQRAGERVMRSITGYLHKRLKLTVNPAKSKVAPMSDCSFLSMTIRAGKVRWTDKAQARFKHRIKGLSDRSWGVSMRQRLKELGAYLRGWMGYFGISVPWRAIEPLDEWIRRRIRMCYWRRWRLRRTKIRNLIRLGVKPKVAFHHGLSGHSHWHMARTPGLQQALNKDWLQTQGLTSLIPLWKKAQGYL